MRRLTVRRWSTGLVLAGLLASGCGGTEQPRASATLLAGIPVAPQASAAGRAAGADAVQAEFQTPMTADSVAAWYRRWLLADGWLTTGDTRAPDGTLTLHAVKNGRPIWLMIQPAGRGATFAIIGAQPDTLVRPGSGN
jgi:hypothetical protein